MGESPAEWMLLGQRPIHKDLPAPSAVDEVEADVALARHQEASRLNLKMMISPGRVFIMRAAAPLRMPRLASPAAGRDACSWQVRVGFAFPGRPQPSWTSSIGGLAPSPLGSPRQEREGSQARYRQPHARCANGILWRTRRAWPALITQIKVESESVSQSLCRGQGHLSLSEKMPPSDQTRNCNVNWRVVRKDDTANPPYGVQTGSCPL